MYLSYSVVSDRVGGLIVSDREERRLQNTDLLWLLFVLVAISIFVEMVKCVFVILIGYE